MSDFVLSNLRSGRAEAKRVADQAAADVEQFDRLIAVHQRTVAATATPPAAAAELGGDPARAHFCPSCGQPVIEAEGTVLHAATRREGCDMDTPAAFPPVLDGAGAVQPETAP